MILKIKHLQHRSTFIALKLSMNRTLKKKTARSTALTPLHHFALTAVDFLGSLRTKRNLFAVIDIVTMIISIKIWCLGPITVGYCKD